MDETLKMFTNDYYTIIARDRADAKALIAEMDGDPSDGDDLEAYAPDDMVEVFGNDGSAAKPAREWCASEGRGVLAMGDG